MQGLPDLFRCEGGVDMAHADGGQSVHHGIGDGYRGRQRGQFTNPFRSHRGQGDSVSSVSRVKVGVVLALGKG